MSDPDRVVEDILRGVSPRPEPPAEVRTRVFNVVEQEWRRRRSRRFLPVLAAAAAVAAVAVLAGVSLIGGDDAFPVELAATRSLWVAGELHRAGGVQLNVEPDTPMVADRVSRLVTASGDDLRLSEGTEIRWLGSKDIALDRGSIYVAAAGSNFEVRTPMGVVTDIGTRFMVTFDAADGALEVAMRDGITEIATDHGTYTAAGDDQNGDVVRVTGDRITARSDLASADRWGWIHEVHPGYSTKAVADLLDAIALDLGRPLVFASPAVRAAVASLELQGDIRGLGPRQALQVVLRTSGLVEMSAAGGALLVDFQSGLD